MSERKCPVCGEIVGVTVGGGEYCNNYKCPIDHLKPIPKNTYADRLEAENADLRKQLVKACAETLDQITKTNERKEHDNAHS